MTSFEKRCQLLNHMMIGTYRYEPYDFFRDDNDLYIYSAVATHLGLVTPGPVMIAHINRTFDSWLFIVGKDKDTGFQTIWEIDSDIPFFETDEFFDEDMRDSIESDEFIDVKGNR